MDFKPALRKLKTAQPKDRLDFLNDMVALGNTLPSPYNEKFLKCLAEDCITVREEAE